MMTLPAPSSGRDRMTISSGAVTVLRPPDGDDIRARVLRALGVVETRHPGKPPHTNKDHGRKGVGASLASRLKRAARGLDALDASPDRSRVLLEAGLAPEKRRQFLAKLETLTAGQVRKLGGPGRKAAIAPDETIDAETRGRITRAVGSYMTTGYKPVGRALHRAAGGPLGDDVSPEVRQQIEDLDRLLDLSRVDRDIVVFRGTKFDGDPPDELTSHGFSSAAADVRVARDFALGMYRGEVTGSTHRPGTPTVLEFLVPKGTPAVQLSPMEVAGEILLGHGQRSRKVRDDGVVNGVRHVVYELIPDA